MRSAWSRKSSSVRPSRMRVRRRSYRAILASAQPRRSSIAARTAAASPASTAWTWTNRSSADRAGAGRLPGEGVEVAAALVGEGEQALAGAAVLVDEPGLHEALLVHPVELAVELLGRGHPEVGDRGVEALGQVVTAGLALQQGGHDGVAQRHAQHHTYSTN